MELYPLPDIQDQINTFCHAKYFTILDMKSGFYQMEIEGVKHVTDFIMPDGHYEFNRMPFGYVNAPTMYQRAMDKALGDIKGTKAVVYLDDIMVPSTTIEQGMTNIELLSALAEGGFSLKYKKCTFVVTDTRVLGRRRK